MEYRKENKVDPQPQPSTKAEADHSLSIVTSKASASLKAREADVLRDWLTPIINKLGLESLKNFPADELSVGFPELIGLLAGSIAAPGQRLHVSSSITETAASIAALRRERPSLGRLVDDYYALKHLLLDAAAGDLRKSDALALAVSKRLDEGFISFFKVGLEAYIERHSRELLHMANTDALTGLYNVRFFRRQLHHNLEMYKRYRIPFSLLMLDLDDLKQLNDNFGHEAGDRALKNVALIMRKEKRETDVAVRYGGDEFFLLLPSTSIDEAERLAWRISHQSRRLNLKTKGREMTGASIGIAECPSNGTDVGSLRAKADRALYLAKTLGGASVARYREFELNNLKT